jgi:Mg-chelatase subunit ChlD
MKKIVSLLFLLAIAGMAAQPDKSQFDLSGPSLAKSGSEAATRTFGSRLVATPASEVTLITGGYYTIGTLQGLTSSALDDDCGITFGHPYALTSTPLLAIDGIWKKVEEFFPADALQPTRKGDTLMIQETTIDSIRFYFALIPSRDGEQIALTAKATNLASVTRSLGLGLVLDPALGRWGDGALFAGGSALPKETLSSMPNREEIWERGRLAKGLGIEITFAQPPDEQLAANWPYILEHPEPGFVAQVTDYLYDLALRWIWRETLVPPGSSRSFTLQISLMPPDFSGRCFARWDLPSALSADGDILFPAQFPCTVELANMSLSQPAALQFDLQLPAELTCTTALPQLTLTPGGRDYLPFTLNASEIFEDKTVPVTLQCLDEQGVADEITRYLHIPRVHFGESGLTVSIDTVITAKYPRVSLAFSTRIAATEQLLTRLSAHNIFLYENEGRIQNFELAKDTTGGVNAADIVFVLDVTGSMGDEIDKVKDNIIEFADSLSARGIDYRVGMVTFLDIIENIYPFTTDIQAFQKNTASQFAHGGDDTPENSLAALLAASQFAFRPQAKRIFIWITDANYHERDSFTALSRQEVLNALLASEITVHAIGSTSYKNDYDAFTIPTGGNFYNIYGNFRDILLDISRMKTAGRYLLTYASPIAEKIERTAKVEVHYAGLGGHQTVTFTPAGAAGQLHLLSCWPNPFNPVTRIHIRHLDGASGEINIYNLLGQRVRQFQVPANSESQGFDWDARSDHGQMVSSGTYFVELLLNDKKNLHRELSRVLYLK